MTKVEAKKNIKDYKDMTAYFDGSFSLEKFQDMLRFRMGFGEGETMVISSALVMAGAFKVNGANISKVSEDDDYKCTVGYLQDLTDMG